MSIRGVCPECGAAVKAAILAIADPDSRILQPIRLPRLVAAGTIGWIAGALGAAIVCWLPHLVDLIELAGVRVVLPPVLWASGLFCVLLSGLSAAVFIRPHARIPLWQSVAAGLAVLMYIPLWSLLGQHLIDHDLVIADPVVSYWKPVWHDSLEVVWICVLIAAIFVLIRPNARLLVARSLLLRTGRVDRQTLRAMAVSAVVIALGQVVGNASVNATGPLGAIGMTLGVVLMAMGAGLLTIGLLGSLADAVRIARAIIRPTRTVKQIIREGAGRASAVGRAEG
ncbi:MAG: hypothetical protein ACK4WH_00680 [Phycisphaerales bacterium]